MTEIKTTMGKNISVVVGTLTVLLNLGCQCQECPDPQEHFEWIDRVNTDTPFRPTLRTPGGAQVEFRTDGLAVNPASLDAAIDRLEICLEDVGALPSNAYPEGVLYHCLLIIVLDDFFDGGRNTRYAGYVEDGKYILLAPTLQSFTHELVHVLTGLKDPFKEEIVDCIDRAQTEVIITPRIVEGAME